MRVSSFGRGLERNRGGFGLGLVWNWSRFGNYSVRVWQGAGKDVVKFGKDLVKIA